MIDIAEESYEEIFETAFNNGLFMVYEANPLREGWPLHKFTSDVVITRAEDIRPTEYYLIDIYKSDMPSELWDRLMWVTEGLPQWIDTYTSGRCSLLAMVERYTPEKMIELVEEARTVVCMVDAYRTKFIERQII